MPGPFDEFDSGPALAVADAPGAPRANAFDEFDAHPVEAPETAQQHWSALFAGVDYAQKKMSPEQRAMFGRLQGIAGEDADVGKRAINQAYAGYLLPKMGGSITTNWPAVRQALAKSALGIDEDMDDTGLYDAINSRVNRDLQQTWAKVEPWDRLKMMFGSKGYGDNVAEGAAPIIGSEAAGTKGAVATIPKAEGTGTFTGLMDASNKMVAGLTSPLNIGIMVGTGGAGVIAEIAAGTRAAVVARATQAAIVGSFTAIGAKDTHEAMAEAQMVFADPASTPAQRADAAATVVLSAAMTAAAAKGTYDLGKGTVGEMNSPQMAEKRQITINSLREQAQKTKDAKMAETLDLAADKLVMESEGGIVPESPPVTAAIEPTESVETVVRTPKEPVVEPQAEKPPEIASDKLSESTPATPPVEPQAKTPAEEVGALNKAEIAQIREDYKLADLPKPVREATEKVLQKAKAENRATSAEALAADVVANPRTVTPEEHAGMVIRATELQNQYEGLMEQAASEMDAGNIHRSTELQRTAANVMESLETITHASDLAGTAAGRTLSIRRMRINRDTYNLAKTVQRAKLAKGRELTAPETEKLRGLTEQIKEQDTKIAQLEKDLQAKTEAAAKAGAESFVEKGRATRKAQTSARAAERRAGLKKELQTLGLRVNDVTGIVGNSAEVAGIIAKIAKTYIEEGIATLPDLVSKLKKDIPDLTEQDIYNSVGGRIREAKKQIETEAAARVKELKKQAALMAEINDAIEGKFDKISSRQKDSPEVAKLRKQLGELRRQADRSARDDTQLQRIHEKINEAQAQLDGGFRNVKTTAERPVESVELGALRTKLRELERLLRTEDAISDLQEQLSTGEFRVSEPEQRVIRNAQLEAALVKRQQLRREVNAKIEAMRPATLGKVVTETAPQLMRALKATADMSAILRQGAFQFSRLAFTNPTKAVRIFSQGVKSFFSKYSADAIDLAIRNNPKQAARDRAGLFLSSLDSVPSLKEESFASNLIERIPVLGALAKASNRNMTTVLNMLRADAFDRVLESKPEATLAQQKELADWINITSGRGRTPKGNAPAAQTVRSLLQLNLAFFAPRFWVSRFQTVTHTFRNLKDPIVRGEIAKDWASFLGAGMTVLALAELGGADVGTDPESPDFGKIVVGDTRIDIWAGLQQPARLTLQPILAGLDRTGIRDADKDIDLVDAGRRFLSYKLSPAITLPAELLTGKTITGQERGDMFSGVIPEGAAAASETMLRAIMPMIVESTMEVYQKDEDAAKAAAAGAASFVGVGVNEQKDKSAQTPLRSGRKIRIRKK